MDAFDTLLKIWPPPPNCRGFCSAQVWENVEREIGLRPPADFQRLLSVYGSGFVGLRTIDPYWLVVHSPLSGPGYSNLVDGFRIHNGILSVRRSVVPESVPYPIPPEPGGLFEFAHDSCGFEYYWLTRGESGEWPLIIDDDSGHLVKLEVSFVEFILQLVRREPPYKSFMSTLEDDLVWTPIDDAH